MKGTVLLDSAAALGTAVFLVYSLSACGGGYSSPSAPSSGGGGSVGATVMLTANGVSDTQPRIALGSRVRFTNNDSRPHQMNSTPHGPHSDCPALNEIGRLEPGQSRETGVLNERRGCGFHDHMNPDDTRFRGQVLVGINEGDPTPPPPGY